MKTLFTPNNIDLDALLLDVIYLMEASGFECTRAGLPTIYVCDDISHSCYIGEDREIHLTKEVVAGDRKELLMTLAHELTHSQQTIEKLVPFGIPYHLRSSEQEAYTVQKMYGIGLLAPKPLKGIWSFLCRYGNRKWYNQQYAEMGLLMQQEPSIVNHRDSQMRLHDKLTTILS